MLKCRPLFSLSSPLSPFLSSSFSSSCRRANPFSSPSPKPPFAKKIPFIASAHGKTWEDPYRWMSNTDDPDLSHYLLQENSYAAAFMADTESLQRQLFEEMRSRTPAKISTPPERWGPWLYYQYIPAGKEYPVLCRKLESNNGLIKMLSNFMRGFGREEILLDWNEVAEQFGYVHVGTCRVSPDHKFLAYTLDTTGRESFLLQIKDLTTGCIIPRSRVEGVVSLAWAKDSCHLLYTVSDETQRPYRVLCTKLGLDCSDSLLYTENDLGCCVDITSTKDGKFITVNSNSRTTSEEGLFSNGFGAYLQVYVIDAARPLDGLQCVRKRVAGVQYFLEHHHDSFYILTDAPSEEMGFCAARDYHLARFRDVNLPSAGWQDIILPSKDIIFEDMDIFNGHLVLFLQRRGFPMVCSINMPISVNCKFSSNYHTYNWITRGSCGIPGYHLVLGFQSNCGMDLDVWCNLPIGLQHPMHIEDLSPWFFPMPPESCSVVPGSNHDFMTHIYRMVLSSPVVPDMIVDYDMSDQTFTIVHQEEVIGVTNNIGLSSSVSNCTNLLDMQTPSDMNFQNIQELHNWSGFSEAYTCERREVTSHDGVRVPLTILYSPKAKKNGQCPGLLQGYGAYGEVLDKSWCAARISLLDRGWVVAYADVRGGGGMGKSWHHAGTGSNKINSMHDLIACSKFLTSEGYVHNNRLCAVGLSAGGLLAGAVINLCPDLFCAAILKVPFVDICNTLLDPNLPLTVLDYEEFGDPRVLKEFETIQSYSPYDNIHPGVCLPSMLVTASFHDSRVGVWEAAKWVARVREETCPSCSRSVILKTNMNGGHFGEGGRFGQYEEAAFEYAFLIKVIGMLDVKQPEVS